MTTYVGSDVRGEAPRRSHVPAYGPIDAALGFALFYVIVDRATPAVVAVFTDLLDVAPSAVGVALAEILWFVGTLTLVDQLRRQLAALGVGTHDEVAREARSRAVPSETRTLAYLTVLLVCGLLAAWTFQSALDTAVSLVYLVRALDVGAFVTGEILELVVFVVSYGLASHALDRLVIGGVRAALWE